MDATMDDLLGGSYDEDYRNPEDNVEWYMKMETDEDGEKKETDLKPWKRMLRGIRRRGG